MSNPDDLNKLIDILGDREKYDRALQILQNPAAAPGGGGNSALGGLALGIGLILAGLALHPTALPALQEYVTQWQQQSPEQPIEEGAVYPPLPPF